MRDAGRADRLGKLAGEAAAHLLQELAVGLGVGDPGERKPLGQRHDAQTQADHGSDRVVLGEHVFGAPAADIEGEHEARQRAQPVTDTAKREPGLGLAAHHVNAAARRALHRRREDAAVRRFADGAGGHDADVARAQTSPALDVVAHRRERSRHRRLAQHAGAGEVLAESGDGLVLIRDAPCRAHRVGDEEPHRVAADVDRTEPHGRKRRRPAGAPGGARGHLNGVGYFPFRVRM